MRRYIDADNFAKQAYKAAYPIVHDTNSHERGLTLMGIAQLLDDQPTADVRENVRGEWIENNGRYGWHCNQCNKDNVYAYITGNDGSNELQDNFCPNCGADMRGDSHE